MVLLLAGASGLPAVAAGGADAADCAVVGGSTSVPTKFSPLWFENSTRVSCRLAGEVVRYVQGFCILCWNRHELIDAWWEALLLVSVLRVCMEEWLLPALLLLADTRFSDRQTKRNILHYICGRTNHSWSQLMTDS